MACVSINKQFWFASNQPISGDGDQLIIIIIIIIIKSLLNRKEAQQTCAF